MPKGHMMGKRSIVVLDFETTGLSPDCGARAIEIGAVMIENDRVVDRFQSLMNPGIRISSFIEDYTGITNAMIRSAPAAEEVMSDFSVFIDGCSLVAHNASFDSRFLDAELDRIGMKRENEFACSMRVSRRLYQDAPDHKLATLVRFKNLQTTGVYHRALSDAEMTGSLWVRMISDIMKEYNFRSVPFELMQRLSSVP
ncbi:MAG: 3'-5' exonuclease, partial [Spirochaetota bacterium]